MRELLASSWADPTREAPEARRGQIVLDLAPQATLHGTARSLEAQLYQRLYTETQGDFAEMARRMLAGADPTAARRVRLRFNQLGLRVRKPSAPKR